MLAKLKLLALKAETHLLNFLELQAPVLHTAWQAAFSAVVVSLLAARSSGDVKAALIAAGTIFLSTLKAAYLAKRS